MQKLKELLKRFEEVLKYEIVGLNREWIGGKKP